VSDIPVDLHEARFSPTGPTPDTDCSQLSGIDRIYNLHKGWGDKLTVISGPEGVGKSVLCWKLMRMAEDNRRVGIMIPAASLVMQCNIEPHSGSAATPAYSTFDTLTDMLDTLERSRDKSLARNVLLVIDGVDAAGGYALSGHHYGATGMLTRIKDLGIWVIITVDSPTAELQSPVLSPYYQALNPGGKATLGIQLTSDR
jgi:hypothetical protein